jgi:hypothetical protein
MLTPFPKSWRVQPPMLLTDGAAHDRVLNGS